MRSCSGFIKRSFLKHAKLAKCFYITILFLTRQMKFIKKSPPKPHPIPPPSGDPSDNPCPSFRNCPAISVPVTEFRDSPVPWLINLFTSIICNTLKFVIVTPRRQLWPRLSSKRKSVVNPTIRERSDLGGVGQHRHNLLVEHVCEILIPWWVMATHYNKPDI